MTAAVFPCRRHTGTVLGLLFLLSSATGGCVGRRPILKIGLVAPFQGRYRDLGYEVIPAIRLAIQEWNATNEPGAELVALDDSGDAGQAPLQARALMLDPQVVAVIGHWLEPTTSAAIVEYDRAGLPLLAPGYSSDAAGDWVYPIYPPVSRLESAARQVAQRQGEQIRWLDIGQEPPGLVAASEVVSHTALVPGQVWAGGLELVDDQFPRLAGPAANGMLLALGAPRAADTPGGQAFDRAYQAATGKAAGPQAVLAYDVTRWLLRAIADAGKAHPFGLFGDSIPTRSEVQAALHRVVFSGLAGEIAVDERGNWRNPPVYVYRFDGGGMPGTLVAVDR